jgi:hypothetical protein
LVLSCGPFEGDTTWLIAVHGRRNAWVRNIEADPAVRLRVRGRWRSGRASVQPPDPATLSRFNLYARGANRLGAIDPLLVRVELE